MDETPWSDRLDAAAVTAAIALLLFFAGTVLTALTIEVSGPGSSGRYGRMQLATQLGNVAYAGVLLAAAGLVAVRQWLTEEEEPTGRSQRVDLLVASTAIILGLCAAVGTINEVLEDGVFPEGYLWAQIAGRVAGLVAALAALWLTDTLPTPFRARSDGPEVDGARPEDDGDDYLSR